MGPILQNTYSYILCALAWKPIVEASEGKKPVWRRSEARAKRKPKAKAKGQRARPREELGRLKQMEILWTDADLAVVDENGVSCARR